jgi:hypothetical protein
LGEEVEIVDYDCRPLLAIHYGTSSGGGVRTALGGFLRRWAGCFDLLLARNSVDFHLVSHGGGDGGNVMRIGGAVVVRVLLLLASS